MAAMMTIRAEQAASHALRATSLPRADPVTAPDERPMSQTPQSSPGFQCAESAILKNIFIGLLVTTLFLLGASSLTFADRRILRPRDPYALDAAPHMKIQSPNRTRTAAKTRWGG